MSYYIKVKSNEMAEAVLFYLESIGYKKAVWNPMFSNIGFFEDETIFFSGPPSNKYKEISPDELFSIKKQPKEIKVKLTNKLTAVVTTAGIKVNCQSFPLNVFDLFGKTLESFSINCGSKEGVIFMFEFFKELGYGFSFGPDVRAYIEKHGWDSSWIYLVVCPDGKKCNANSCGNDSTRSRFTISEFFAKRTIKLSDSVRVFERNDGLDVSINGGSDIFLDNEKIKELKQAIKEVCS